MVGGFGLQAKHERFHDRFVHVAFPSSVVILSPV